MATEIFCFDHESEQFQSISSIGPSGKWASGLLGAVVNIIEVSCLPDDERTEVRIIESHLTPEQASTPTTNLFEGLDPDSAWLKEVVEEDKGTAFSISDSRYPGKGTTIFVRHREPQDWRNN